MATSLATRLWRSTYKAWQTLMDRRWPPRGTPAWLTALLPKWPSRAPAKGFGKQKTIHEQQGPDRLQIRVISNNPKERELPTDLPEPISTAIKAMNQRQRKAIQTGPLPKPLQQAAQTGATIHTHICDQHGREHYLIRIRAGDRRTG